MINLPKISVVVPNFNQGAFLGETLDSILAQKYPSLELILIDGGSTDSSLEVIRAYQDQLTYSCSEPDQGHYDAVNKGMAKATGEILAFLNSDDKFFPGSLRIVGEIFSAHPTVDWLASLSPAGWDVMGHCIGVGSIPGYSRAAFLDGGYGGLKSSPWFIQQESTFWRRSLWEKTGNRIATEITYAGDFDLWGRFFEHAELVGVNTLLGGYRTREGQRGREGTYHGDQAAERLQDFRRRARWSRQPLRQLATSLRLFGVNRVGGLLRKTLGYRGKRIIRHNPGSPTATWRLEEYRFP